MCAADREWRPKLYRGAWYAVRTEGGKSRRKALNTKIREVALARFDDFVKTQEAPKETISEILDAWRKEKNLKSAKTADLCVKTLKPFWGHLKPHQVTREKCREYISKRNKRASTVRRELQVLRAALYWNDRQTKAQIEMPAASPPRERYLTREEYGKLLAAAVSPHVKLFIILALSTGGRMSAILELTWDRVDFKGGLIKLSVGGEGNKRRATIPMTESCRAALEEHYKARTSDYVIEYGGEKIGNILIAFKRTAKRAGLQGVSPHVLRHTSAVWMAEGGVPMSEISQFLGHSSTKVTESVYARYSPQYLRKAASALELG